MKHEYYDLLRTTSLPHFCGSEKVDDWIVELIELDSYFAGLALFSEGSVRILKREIPQLSLLRERLEEITFNCLADPETLNKCKSYLELLEAIRVHLLKSAS